MKSVIITVIKPHHTKAQDWMALLVNPTRHMKNFYLLFSNYSKELKRLEHSQIHSMRQPWASLVAQLVKNLPAMRETWVWSLGWDDPLEKGKATSSLLTWRIPWNIQSLGLQRRHDWVAFTFTLSLNGIYSPQMLPNAWLAWGCQRQACCLKVKKKNNVLRRAPGLVWVSKAKDIFLLNFLFIFLLAFSISLHLKASPK